MWRPARNTRKPLHIIPPHTLHKRRHAPVLFCAAHAHHKVAQHVLPLRRVVHLGVELQPKQPVGPPHAGRGRELAVRRAAHGHEARGHGRDLVPVRHPHLEGAGQARQQVARAATLCARGQGRLAHVRVPKLAVRGLLHLAAQRMRHLLEAVADAQDGQPALLRELPDGGLHVGRALLVHGEGAARQDDALEVGRAQHGLLHQAGVHLAVHVQLAHAARNDVRVLGAKVKDGDGLAVDAEGVGHGARAERR